MTAGAIPLYHRVFTALRGRIANGTYPVGGQLPTESAFITEFGVGRQTVRAALQQLEQEGLIERFAGRGTFVAAQSATRNRWMLDSIEDLIDSSFAAKYAIVSAGFVPARGEARLQALFAVTTSARLFFVRALRSSEQGPYAYSRIHLPGAIGEKLPRELLPTRPLLLLAEAHAGAVAVRARQVTSCGPANRDAAALLEVPEQTPLLIMARTYFAADGSAIVHSLVQARADRYEQIVNVWRRGEHGRPAGERPDVATHDASASRGTATLNGRNRESQR
jgi:GntR family transcriptional regulator